MRRTLSLLQQPSPTSRASMRHNPIVGRYPLPLHILMIEDSKSCDRWGLTPTSPRTLNGYIYIKRLYNLS